jgi:GxxExxY protein
MIERTVMNIEELGKIVISSAIEVHRELGPGLLESTYERCLFHELTLRGIKVERQKSQPIEYKGLQIDEGYRLDLLVDGRIILELKVVDRINDIHYAQLLTYLKLSGCNLGFLINFNTTLLKHGLKRVVNNLPE